jgi:hypothetical protein
MKLGEACERYDSAFRKKSRNPLGMAISQIHFMLTKNWAWFRKATHPITSNWRSAADATGQRGPAPVERPDFRHKRGCSAAVAGFAGFLSGTLDSALLAPFFYG